MSALAPTCAFPIYTGLCLPNLCFCIFVCFTCCSITGLAPKLQAKSHSQALPIVWARQVNAAGTHSRQTPCEQPRLCHVLAPRLALLALHWCFFIGRGQRLCRWPFLAITGPADLAASVKRPPALSESMRMSSHASATHYVLVTLQFMKAAHAHTHTHPA